MTDVGEPYLGTPEDLASLEARLDLEAERRRSEGARRQWLETVDAIADPIMVHDAEGRIVRTNKAYAALAGIGLRELIGRRYWDCFPLRGGPMTGCLEGRCAGGHPEEFAVAGRTIYTSTASRLGGGADAQILHVFHDITAERGREENLRARARRAIAQSQALDTITGSGALQAGDLNVLARELTEAVSAACDVARVNVWLFNEDETELHCIDHYDAAARAHASGMVLRQSQFANEFRALKSVPYVAADDPLTDPRSAGYVEAYLKPNRITAMLDAVVSVSGHHLGLLCLEHVDRPHHWEADEIGFAQQAAHFIAIALSNRRARKSEARFRGFFDLGLIGMAITMPDKKFADVNDKLCEMLGYSRSELLLLDWASLTHPEDLPANAREFERALAGEIDGYVLDKRFVRKDGAMVFATISASCMRGADRSVEYFMLLVQDVTARRRADQALRASRDLLGAVVENAPMRVFWKSAELRYLGCNSAFAHDAGLAKPVDLVGRDDFQMPWRQQAESYRADDQAVLESKVPKLNYEEPQTTADGRTRWLRTSKVPLRDAEGGTVGLLGIYEDITEHKAALAERERAQGELRGALVATVQAMAATVEARDPYTAGHQRRVADLAAAIAREMELPADTVEGIHFGALLHDLGKIQVPAELLAKPTRLSKPEFELIKGHPQAGYEIVKSIRFPWRVAEMVHQHHERLDGSGYPQGLKGEAIALEARILAVADVMEAISSHRPYRPARGVNVALRELESKRGIEFDAAAVDACLRLFRDKGYDLDRGHAGERG